MSVTVFDDSLKWSVFKKMLTSLLYTLNCRYVMSCKMLRSSSDYYSSIHLSALLYSY